MAYDPVEKFNQPEDGIVLVGASPNDAEIAEAQQRIARGEDSQAVWADIDARVAKRWQERIDNIDGPMPEIDAL